MSLHHNIPTHLDEADKFILNLTARQTLILGIGLAFGYMFFNEFDYTTLPGFLMGGSLFAGCVVLAVITAFLKIRHRDFEHWFLLYVLFHTQPRYYLRKPQTVDVPTEPSKSQQKEEQTETDGTGWHREGSNDDRW